MLLTGRIQNDNYTNKNGEKVYSVQVIAEEIEFAERKSAADAAFSAGAGQGSEPNPMPAPPEPSAADGGDDFVDIEGAGQGDIPFFA